MLSYESKPSGKNKNLGANRANVFLPFVGNVNVGRSATVDYTHVLYKERKKFDLVATEHASWNVLSCLVLSYSIGAMNVGSLQSFLSARFLSTINKQLRVIGTTDPPFIDRACFQFKLSNRELT